MWTLQVIDNFVSSIHCSFYYYSKLIIIASDTLPEVLFLNLLLIDSWMLKYTHIPYSELCICTDAYIF